MSMNYRKLDKQPLNYEGDKRDYASAAKRASEKSNLYFSRPFIAGLNGNTTRSKGLRVTQKVITSLTAT